MDSFKSIYDECQMIVCELQRCLFAKIDEPGLPQRRLVQYFELIRKLERGGSTEQLCHNLLQRATEQFSADHQSQENEYRQL